MSSFIKNPNLPQSPVTLAVISPQIQKEAALELARRGMKLVFTDPCGTLQQAVSCHADMLVHHKGGREVLLAPSQNTVGEQLKKANPNYKISYLNENPKREYPLDVPLNCCVFGQNIICNVKYISQILLDFYKKMDYKIINTSQGYAKCASLVIDENSIITDDESIHTACSKEGIDSLLISKGEINLPGYNYGFIGGAGGFINRDTLAFFGDISTHPDSFKIRTFLNKKGKEALSLCEGQLLDLGGIIPLEENNL